MNSDKFKSKLKMRNDFKLSFYTVFSEPVVSGGDLIVYSTRSSTAYYLPKSFYNYLIDNHLDLIPDDIFTELVNHKILVPLIEDELSSVLNQNIESISESDSETLYEIIQPSAMCQLGCYYCGQEHSKDYLDNFYIQAIVQNIRKKLQNGHFSRLIVAWFGAEPLMGLKQIRLLTASFKELAFEFKLDYSSKIVTNGLSLKKGIYDELVNDLSVNFIEVTLDGPAEFHDNHRYTKDRQPSFDIIFNNLLSIFNSDNYSTEKCSINIRCNVDKDNVNGVESLIDLLAFHKLQSKIAYFYIIGIYSWGNDAHLNSLSKEDFAQLEIEWLIKLMELGFNVSLLPGRTTKVCMAVSNNSEMYDAFGNIFNCTEVSYVPKYSSTNYVAGNLKDENRVQKERMFVNWNQDLPKSDYDCPSCKMLPVCGGGCPKSWAEGNRACPTPKFNIKERLQLYYINSIADIKDIINVE